MNKRKRIKANVKHIQFYLTEVQYQGLMVLSEFYGVSPNNAAKMATLNKIYIMKANKETAQLPPKEPSSEEKIV